MKAIFTSLLFLFAIAMGKAQPGPSGDYRLDHYEHLYDGSGQPALLYIDAVIVPSSLTTTKINGETFFVADATRPSDRTTLPVYMNKAQMDTVNANYSKGFATQFKVVVTSDKKNVFAQSLGRAVILPDGTVKFKRQGDELTPKERKDMEKRRRKELRKSHGGNKGYGRRKGVQSSQANPDQNGSGQSQGAPSSQQRQKRRWGWGLNVTAAAQTQIGNVIVSETVGNNGDGTGTYTNTGIAVQNEWGIASGGFGNGVPANSGMMQGLGMQMNNGMMMNGQQPFINGQQNLNMNAPPVMMGGCANCYIVNE